MLSVHDTCAETQHMSITIRIGGALRVGSTISTPHRRTWTQSSGMDFLARGSRGQTPLQFLASGALLVRTHFGGLVGYDATLVEGLGIVRATDYADGEYPFQYAYDLQGCIIRDSLYGIVVSVPQPEVLPAGFALSQNYPNPFNATTVVRYQLSAASDVSLAIYDLLGREVAVLVNGPKLPGSYSVTFDGSSLATGVYFYRLSTATATTQRSMILLK